MSRTNLIKSLIKVVFVALFVVGCGASGEAPVTETATLELTATPQDTATPELTGITISGVITNLLAAQEQYIAEDSFLQLLPYPADGQLAFTTDDKGRLVYTSDLAQVPLPQDGIFAFQLESLEPGSYLIAAQKLRASSFMMPLLVQDGELVTFEIPPDAALPLVIDLGEVAIQLP